MSIQLSWYLENRIILLTSHGESSDQDLLNLDQPIINYLNQSQAPLVHLIADHRRGGKMPSLKVSMQIEWPKHPQYGWGILVGLTNPLQRFLVVVASNFFNVRQRMFNTMDEALDFLNEVDSTLPALRSNTLDKAS
jgi:hypothetical protein